MQRTLWDEMSWLLRLRKGLGRSHGWPWPRPGVKERLGEQAASTVPVLLLSLPLPPEDSRVSRKVSSGTWTRDSLMASLARLCGAVTTAAVVSGGRGRSTDGEVTSKTHVWHSWSDHPSNPAICYSSQLCPHLPSVRSSQLHEATRLARQPP